MAKSAISSLQSGREVERSRKEREGERGGTSGVKRLPG
jgi:hypothetical protein